MQHVGPTQATLSPPCRMLPSDAPLITARFKGRVMKRSTNKILVSHAGVLPRPPALLDAMRGGPSRDAGFVGMLPQAVKDIVKQQVEAGFDVVNDGEFSKRGGFSGYPRERLSNLETREFKP